MRIPFLTYREPESYKNFSARATIIPTSEGAMPKLREPPPTLEEARAAGERSRQRRLNGRAPS